MTTQDAIDVLKERSAWIKQHFEESTHAEAIDTVVAELENPLPTDNELMKILYDLRDRDIAVSDAYERITLSSKNTENKKGLDDRLRDKLIEQPDNQKGLSSKKDMELPTDEQIREMSNEYARKHTEPKGRVCFKQTIWVSKRCNMDERFNTGKE